MKKSICLILMLAVMLLVAAPAASAYIEHPTTAVANGTVGSWATLRSTAYLSWPTSTTVRVDRVNAVVTSTHVGVHRVDWCKVQVRTGTSTPYSRTCYTDHYITNFGSATCLHYPGKTLNALAVNQVGTSLRYLGECLFSVTTPVYWTGNFGG